MGIKKYNSISEIVAFRARFSPDKIAYTFLGNELDEEFHLTYEELHSSASNIAKKLLTKFKKQDRIVLFFPPGLDFIKSFFGCLYAGMIAVPSYPPKMNRSGDRMKGILEDSQPSAILTQSGLGYEKVLAKIDNLVTPIIYVDQLEKASKNIILPQNNSDEIAFLQYTSGSTGNPKGVIISHENIMDNQRLIKNVFQLNESSILVGWLPFYHDMGLVGNILHPMYIGFRAILFGPVQFLRSPEFWLQTISRYKATVSGGPNFAYELCYKSISDFILGSLDLSSWEIAFNGAEPISVETINKFSNRFKTCGFNKNSFLPCYGMAETTLLVSGISAKQSVITNTFSEKQLQFNTSGPMYSGRDIELVSCGEVGNGFNIKIIDVNGDEVTENSVGEICLQGSSVSKGYWQSSQKNVKDLQYRIDGIEGKFFKTGDLGLLKDKHLYITGRLKDILIINGKNYYPQDIEEVVGQICGEIITGRIAAFSVQVNNSERLVVIAECKLGNEINVFDIIHQIQRKIIEIYTIPVYDIVLIRSGSIFKTSSGKIQRSVCKEAYLNAELRKIDSLLDKKQPNRVSLERDLENNHTSKKIFEFFKSELGQIQPFEVHNNFFESGLDSILLMRLIFFIEDEFNKEISLEELYKYATIAELASYIDTCKEDTLTVEEVNENKKWKATYLQQSIWVNQQRELSNSGYNIPVLLKLETPISLKNVKRALNYLVDKYDVLRTIFRLENESIYQMVNDNFDFEFETLSVNKMDEQEVFIKAFSRKPFLLDKGPLLRSSCVSLGTDESILLIVIHHILLDAKSVALLVEEFKTIYSLLNDNVTLLQSEKCHNQFIDFCKEEVNLERNKGTYQREFWNKYLKPLPPPLQLPKRATHNKELSAESISFLIDGKQLSNIKQYIQNEKINLFAFLLSGYYILLNLLTGSNSIVIGAPLSLRNKKKFQETIGLFINSIMLKAVIKENECLESFVKKVYDESREAVLYGSYPFQKIVEDLNLGIAENRLGITSVFFNYLDNQEEISGDTLDTIYRSNPGVDLNFDLNLYVLPTDNEVKFRLDYNKGDFSIVSIKNVIYCYKEVLNEIIKNSDELISDLSYWSFVKQGISKTVNHGLFSLEDREKLVWEKFEDVVHSNSNKMAIQGIDKDYSYLEVFQLSNSICDQIREVLEFEKTENIGLCFGHHEHMILSMLAVLKSGNAYVPIDLTLPQERKEYFIKDADIRFVLTDSSNYKAVQHLVAIMKTPVEIIVINNSSESLRDIQLNTSRNFNSDSRAYILYTSGSTGNPKGVIQSQQYIMHIAYSFINSLKIDSDDCISLIPTFNFSASMMDVFGALLSGASLKIVDIKEGGVTGLIDAINTSKITIYHSVPTIFRELVNIGEKMNAHKELLNSVRIIYLAGEPLLKKDVVSYQQLFNDDCLMVNGLGCTEFNICSQYFIDKTTQVVSPYVPLGFDGLDVEVIILDESQFPVRELKEGEIALKSKYLSKGYWKLPELTKERFITIDQERYYLTGDLGRRLPDGKLIHSGRKDFQVKLRGQRIELGEIESGLNKIPGINDAVVILKKINDSNELCAYYISEKPFERNVLIKQLAAFLPSYMVPQYYEQLDSFPLTTSNKVDRRNLPDPTQTYLLKNKGAENIRTEKAEQLAMLWAEILNCDPNTIEMDSDFLILGGTSLKAIELINQIHVKFHVKLAFSELIQNLVLSEMNHLIQNKEKISIEVIPSLSKFKKESSGPELITKKNKITL
ncbi:AMP-binding protein [Snuella sedimenti]|uniref:AMP-binding protein n=1 Tax=Snuella sedimenti TaxID=2798802 RepID=A0A8J7LQF8_9FLAO|nr:AMP-binding protein [Snuella sedimenti]MBJ6369744.1 AMP-binding protein [Snuella sedimenti]